MSINLKDYIRPNRTEKEICASFWTHVHKLKHMNYFKNDFLIFHIANEQYTKKSYTIQLQRIGLTAGVPDYCILLPNGKVGFIEFKRNSKCTLTNTQKAFAAYCQNLKIPCYIAYSEVDGIDYIVEMLLNC